MGTLDFTLGRSPEHSPQRGGLLAGVLFQQRAVLDGGLRMQRAATAIVSGHDTGAGKGSTVSAAAMLDQYRPGLVLSAAVAIAALLVAASPARRRRALTEQPAA